MAAYVEGVTVTAAQLKTALRKGVLCNALHPVLLGAALRNRGVQPLLDAVTDYLPSPLDTPPPVARLTGAGEESLPLPCDPRGPLCALAFKVVADEGRKLTYLRLYSGTLHTGALLWNSSRGGSDRVARIFRMHAHRREKVEEAVAGEIVAATGLRDVLTGDSLASPEQPLLLQGVTVPEPVVSLAVEARGVDDRERLPQVLEKLQWEDPTFRVHEDAETGQTILTGMGELHLEIIIDRMQREFGVQVKTGRPQVVYRETLNKAIQHHELFHRESEGHVQHGEIELRLTPLARSHGVEIVLDPIGTSELPEALRLSLRNSLQQSCSGGALAGYPLTDLAVEILHAPFQPGVTTELGLRAAAQRGLALAARDGEPILLEPWMALELTVPDENAGRVLGSLQQKRGRIEGMEVHGTDQVIRANVPLAEMFGYMTELRSASKGRGTYTMEFSHFDRAPDETLQRFSGR
jgi:elongation factor G